MEFRPTTPVAPRVPPPPVLSELDASALLDSIGEIKDLAVAGARGGNGSKPGHQFSLPERLRPTSSIAAPMRRGGIKGSGLRKTLHRGHALHQTLDRSNESIKIHEPKILDESVDREGEHTRTFTDTASPRRGTSLVNFQLCTSSGAAHSQPQVSLSRNMRGWKLSGPGASSRDTLTRAASGPASAPMTQISEALCVDNQSDISRYRVFQRQVSAVDRVLSTQARIRERREMKLKCSKRLPQGLDSIAQPLSPPFSKEYIKIYNGPDSEGREHESTENENADDLSTMSNELLSEEKFKSLVRKTRIQQERLHRLPITGRVKSAADPGAASPPRSPTQRPPTNTVAFPAADSLLVQGSPAPETTRGLVNSSRSVFLRTPQYVLSTAADDDLSVGSSDSTDLAMIKRLQLKPLDRHGHWGIVPEPEPDILPRHPSLLSIVSRMPDLALLPVTDRIDSETGSSRTDRSTTVHSPGRLGRAPEGAPPDLAAAALDGVSIQGSVLADLVNECLNSVEDSWMGAGAEINDEDTNELFLLELQMKQRQRSPDDHESRQASR